MYNNWLEPTPEYCHFFKLYEFQFQNLRGKVGLQIPHDKWNRMSWIIKKLNK